MGIMITGNESLEFLNIMAQREVIFPLFYLVLSNLNRDTLKQSVSCKQKRVTRSQVSVENNRKFA